MSEREWKNFNVNNYVRVKLTPVGLAALRENHRTLYPNMQFPYTEPEVDEDGYTQFQMWDLMKELGRTCGNGYPMAFESEIQINVGRVW